MSTSVIFSRIQPNTLLCLRHTFIINKNLYAAAKTLKVQQPTLQYNQINKSNDELLIDHHRDINLTSKFISQGLLQDGPVSVHRGYLDAYPYTMYVRGNKNTILPNLSNEEKCALKFAAMPSKPAAKETPPKMPGKPSEEQLEKIYQALELQLPKFFVSSLDYRIYHPQITFINNIKGKTSHGLTGYVQQMAMARILGHICYSYVSMKVLQITKDEKEGTIKVRWRVVGVPGLKIVFLFWRYKFWNWKELMSQQTEWTDGYSVFHVGDDGLVHKHICDKVIPSKDTVPLKAEGDIAVKLAMILGLVPGHDLSTPFVIENAPLLLFNDADTKE